MTFTTKAEFDEFMKKLYEGTDLLRLYIEEHPKLEYEAWKKMREYTAYPGLEILIEEEKDDDNDVQK